MTAIGWNQKTIDTFHAQKGRVANQPKVCRAATEGVFVAYLPNLYKLLAPEQGFEP